MSDVDVWPDAQRGIHALLDGVEIDGFKLQPEATPDRVSFGDGTTVVVHLETIDTREGDVDRVQEVRMTVYGNSVYVSRDLYERILSLITGTDILTPALHSWPEFYFDDIERRQGPTSPAYPDNTIAPAVGTVLCRARPMA